MKIMKRPNIEDYHQDKTGESLMNGPYNRMRYSEDLETYVEHLEAKVLNLSQQVVINSDKVVIKEVVNIGVNKGDLYL